MLSISSLVGMIVYNILCLKQVCFSYFILYVNFIWIYFLTIFGVSLDTSICQIKFSFLIGNAIFRCPMCLIVNRSYDFFSMVLLIYFACVYVIFFLCLGVGTNNWLTSVFIESFLHSLLFWVWVNFILFTLGLSF